MYYTGMRLLKKTSRVHQPAALALTLAAAAAAAAVASALVMTWRMMACRTSGRGGCYDGLDGRGATCGSHVGDCVYESVRTVGWSRDTVACPGSAGSVWCRSS